MPPRSGEELKEELDLDRSPDHEGARDGRARDGPAEGIDNIVDAHTGGLIVIGDADELSFPVLGGIKLDIDYCRPCSTSWPRWTAQSR